MAKCDMVFRNGTNSRGSGGNGIESVRRCREQAFPPGADRHGLARQHRYIQHDSLRFDEASVRGNALTPKGLGSFFRQGVRAVLFQARLSFRTGKTAHWGIAARFNPLLRSFLPFDVRNPNRKRDIEAA